MTNTMTDKRAGVALLIDSENIVPDILAHFFDKIMALGDLRVRRLIGNFRAFSTASWKKCEERYALSAVQSTSYVSGKNTSDLRLVIEALSLFYETDIRTFVIMSSDSDFTQLAIFLREKGAAVIGIGSELAPLAWQCAVSDFWIYRKPATAPDKSTAVPAKKKKASVNKTVVQAAAAPKAAVNKNRLTQEKTLHRWIRYFCNEYKGPKGWMLITKLESILQAHFKINYRKSWQVDNLQAFLKHHKDRYETSRNQMVKPLF